MVLRLLCSVLLLLCLQTGSVFARPEVSGLNRSPSHTQSSAQGAVPHPMEPEVSILGAAEATEEQLVAYIRERNPHPRINCSIEEMVATYFREGAAEGVRGDIALCQALKETGFFRYGGTVKPRQNNFCGLGTTSATVGGASFTTVERGVRAHIQHLMAYATTERPRQQILDPRYDMVRKVHRDYAGMISSWTGLNGTWAVPGKGYGQSILQMWEQAKNEDETRQHLLREYGKRIAKGDAKASLNRGKLYAQLKQYDKALADYQKAEQSGLLRAEVLVLEGLTFEGKGDAAMAVKCYERALAEEKRSPIAMACLNNLRKRPAMQGPHVIDDHGRDKHRDKDNSMHARKKRK